MHCISLHINYKDYLVFPTCISQDALFPGKVNEAQEFLLDLNVQTASPAPLDKAHPQTHHKLSLLYWDQKPIKKLVPPKYKTINTTSVFRQRCFFISTVLAVQKTNAKVNFKISLYLISKANKSLSLQHKKIFNCYTHRTFLTHTTNSLKHLNRLCPTKSNTKVCSKPTQAKLHMEHEVLYCILTNAV
jgi:hypothetical protein